MSVQDVGKSAQARICPKCQTSMRLYSCGRKRKIWRCHRCHAENMRTKYIESRRAATRRYRRTEKRKKNDRRLAVKECGVPSLTSVYSKISERHATQARQRWTGADDHFLMNSGLKETDLAKRLGRSIRAIQRRKFRLREPERKASTTERKSADESPDSHSLGEDK